MLWVLTVNYELNKIVHCLMGEYLMKRNYMIRRKKKRKFGKVIILSIFLLSIFRIHSFYAYKEKLDLHNNIYCFLKGDENRLETYSTAVDLHNGDASNTCVYFVAEVLRKNDYEVPEYICNTNEFVPFLEKQSWKKDYDYKKLKSGDICFTTDAFGNKHGIPTHTYIFMGWVEEGIYDYAYICDNQAKDYEDRVYHIRNINITDNVNGYTKDAFSFFMKNY